jgi:hypothetical protein
VHRRSSRLALDGVSVTTMRKLKHPIPLFVAVVLVVIGIGVGVVAATTSQKVHGPSWGRFTAVFAGPVHQYRGRTSVAFVKGGGRDVSPALRSTITLTFPYFAYSNVRLSYWVGYLPYAAETVSAIRGVPPGPVIAFTKRGYPGATVIPKRANGISVAIFGPNCKLGPCTAAKIVSNGRVLWTVVVASTFSAGAAESFLDSFQPIG